MKIAIPVGRSGASIYAMYQKQSADLRGFYIVRRYGRLIMDQELKYLEYGSQMAKRPRIAILGAGARMLGKNRCLGQKWLCLNYVYETIFGETENDTFY